MQSLQTGIPAPALVRVVALLTGVNLLILLIRNSVVGNSNFNFLLANLFSGFLPLVIAYAMLFFRQRLNALVFWLGSLLWIVFYPNSPYMISDLIHDDMDTKPTVNPAAKLADFVDANLEIDQTVDDTLIIFNTFIIFSIAMLSVFYGFLSLKIMYNLFRARYGPKLANTFITVSLLLSCVGFYVGRMIAAGKVHPGTGGSFDSPNLYTWDLFAHPIAVIEEIWNGLFPVGEHLSAYAMMALFGIVQYSLLVMMRDVQAIQSVGLDVNESATPVSYPQKQ